MGRNKRAAGGIINMKLYLVRHGKSNASENNKRQAPTSPLSEEGKKQALALAERMTKEEIDILISSKWDRAYQTAEAVSKKLNLKLETIEGIHEKEHHPDMYGVSLDNELFRKYWKEVEKKESNLDWKFGGRGESLRDLINRVEKFQKHLIENHKNQNVLVVTHGLFVRTFVILSLLQDKFNDEVFYKLFTSISIENTGITLLEYLPDRNHWELKFLNDHLHIK